MYGWAKASEAMAPLYDEGSVTPVD